MKKPKSLHTALHTALRRALITALFYLITSLPPTGGQWVASQNISINESGAIGSVSSMLDIQPDVNFNKGLLIPRLTLAQRGTIATPATGLLIFQTDNTPGFYYYNGTAWVTLLTGSSSGPGGWALTGNTGTNSGTNFLGTTDNVSLRIRSNNLERMVVDSTGNVGIGTTDPGNILSVRRGGNAANIPTDYLSSITHSWNAINKYGLIVGTNWASPENFVVNFGNYNGVTGAYTSYFALKGEGNVGIGTTSPIGRLNVIGTSSDVADSGPVVELGVSGSNDQFELGIDGTNRVTWLRSHRSGIGTNILSLQPTGGNVGIGTTAPDFKLHIGSGGPGFTAGGTFGGIYVEPGVDATRIMMEGNGQADIILGDMGGALNDKYMQLVTDGGLTTFRALSDAGGIQTNNILVMDHSSGNVGIGTTILNSPLTVQANPSAGAVILMGRAGDDMAGLYFVNNGGGVSQALILSNNSSGLEIRELANLGAHIYTNNLERVTITAAGNVGIGTAVPTALLSVNGTANKPGGGAWDIFSDERLKKDVRPFTDGLNVIDKINPVSFRYNGKAGITVQDTYVGVIAQQMQKIAPYTIKTVKMKLDTSDAEPSDILEFDPNALWYININAIKELKAENDALKKRLLRVEELISIKAKKE